MPDFLVIALVLAIARWVYRSVMEQSTQAPEVKSRAPQVSTRPGDKRGAPARRSGATGRHEVTAHDWHVLLDVSQDAPRSEIQAAAKRRRAQARANGDSVALAHINRAASAGLKHSRR